MKKRFFYRIALSVMAMLLTVNTFSASAWGGESISDSFLYNEDGIDVPSTAAFQLKTTVSLSAEDMALSAPQDLFEANGKLYITDTGNSRILVYDDHYALQQVIQEIPAADGTVTTMNQPEGLFVQENGEILIADTGNSRILRLSADGVLLQEIGRPSGMTGVDDSTKFMPTKLTVDSVGRLYVIARNINMGLIQLDAQGKFVGYIGAPEVKVDFWTLLWRRFSTKEQISKMEEFVPTEYSNIAVNAEGYIYGTISALDAEDVRTAINAKDTSGYTTPIRKLNSSGADVLKRNGTYAPLGDLVFDKTPSKIVDVAIGNNGVYALLDDTLGHIFLYDDNGNLLCGFGRIGTQKDDFRRPVSLAVQGDRLLVLDSLLGALFVYEQTDYGKLLMDAVSAEYVGDFETAYHLWEQVAVQNVNFEYAYIGLGQACMQQKDYQNAKKYFQYADSKALYSEAAALQRKEQMGQVFPVILFGIIGLAILLIAIHWLLRAIRYCSRHDSETGGK